MTAVGNYQSTYIFTTLFDLQRTCKIKLADHCIALKQANMKGFFQTLKIYALALHFISTYKSRKKNGERDKRDESKIKHRIGARTRSPAFAQSPGNTES